MDTDEEAMMGSEIMGPAGQIHVDDDGSGDGVPVVSLARAREIVPLIPASS